MVHCGQLLIMAERNFMFLAKRSPTPTRFQETWYFLQIGSMRPSWSLNRRWFPNIVVFFKKGCRWSAKKLRYLHGHLALQGSEEKLSEQCLLLTGLGNNREMEAWQITAKKYRSSPTSFCLFLHIHCPDHSAYIWLLGWNGTDNPQKWFGYSSPWSGRKKHWPRTPQSRARREVSFIRHAKMKLAATFYPWAL